MLRGDKRDYMKITEIFKLNKTQREIDFVDIDFPNDVPLFLNPFIIRDNSSSLGIECEECISTFFELVIEYLKNGNEIAAQELMSKVGEINEIHLGLSLGKSRGNGIGKENANRLVSSILKSEAVKSGVVEKLEDFSLFIDGIGRDKISDLIANVIKKCLIEYTKTQCKLWGIPTNKMCKTGFYWNHIERKWEQGVDEMLVIDNQIVILVPKDFVSCTRSSAQSIYYQHYVLEFFQEEYVRTNHYLVRERRDKKGNLVEKYVYKKDIDEDFRKNNIVINKAWLADFSTKHPEILDKYRKEAVLSEIDPNEKASPAELNEIADRIICELNKLPSGDDFAIAYQRLVCGACELIFYPALSNPKMETPIQDGLKRIDITFSNRAEEGFFKKIIDINDIPAHLIMIECKNYSNDIENPEFDQLIGRFSNNRGKIGFLFCRKLKNEKKMIKREIALWKERSEVVIHITDDRLIYLLNCYKDCFNYSYNETLLSLLDEIMRS